MASRRTDEASRLTSALTATGVALGVAREATDALPIVKQVLGATVRIVGLAEKMENDREALRALADSSVQLARQVRDVMEGKTPDSAIQVSLERVLWALDGIEAFMKKHAARNRLRRLVSYAFTVPQHVKHLSGGLGDTVRDLTVVVLLATHAAVQDSVRFEGNFRLLRDCEVEKLEAIDEQAIGDNLIIRYHRAKVDGELVVVRYFEESLLQHPHSDQTPQDMMFNHIASHDSILQEISTVQKSHRNVARIYGWNQGSACNRFTVFKSGYHPAYDSLFEHLPDPVITSIRWIMQDAVQHLQSLGILWTPYYPNYTLDDQLQPIIGHHNDLQRMGKNVDQLLVAQGQMFQMTLQLLLCTPGTNLPEATTRKLLAGCRNDRLSNLLERMEITRRRFMIHKAEFSDSRVLTDAAAEYLLFMSEGKSSYSPLFDSLRTWTKILLALDKNRNHPARSGLRVVYYAHLCGGDDICLSGIGQDSEHIVYDWYTPIRVPDELKDELREMFTVPMPSEEERNTAQVIATGPYRMLY